MSVIKNFPNTIDEWINERIVFISDLVHKSENFIALENFKYCRKLYDHIKQNKKNADVVSLFKNLANKLIMDTIFELDKLEYECVPVNGISYPTKQKMPLPQESIDGINHVRSSMKNIHTQINNL